MRHKQINLLKEMKIKQISQTKKASLANSQKRKMPKILKQKIKMTM
jgi:hypothetical protein